jgi:NAD+ synthase
VFSFLETWGLFSPYSLIISTAAAVGLGLSARLFRGRRAFLVDVGGGVMLGALIGARLDHVLLHWAYFQARPEEIIQLWEGGLGWAGAVLGGTLVLVGLSLFSGRLLGTLMDALLPAAGITASGVWLAVWGTGSIYGPRTGAWWGLPAPDAFGVVDQRVPLSLLGAGLILLGTALIRWIRFRPWLAWPGQRFLLLMTLICAAAAGLSFLRVDPGPALWGIRRSAWTGGPLGILYLTAYVSLTRKSTMEKLKIDPQYAADQLVNFIRETVHEAGFSRAVIGLSGGVDSALSAYLTVQALGAENVLGLRMPYETSSPESLEHAELVIEQTGIQSETYSITAAVDAILEDFPEAGQVRRGNVMARMRMIYLYDQSHAFEGLVMGTGNKTETLLGYSTRYGDGAFDLNPLADLYKAQVRQLASFLGVPRAIIEKPPSADLWLGQTDEEELGFTYQDADQLLYLLVEEQNTASECVEAGFDEELVETVIGRVLRYRFKSKLPPAGSIGQASLEHLEELPAFQD